MRDGKTLVGPVSKEQSTAVKEHLLSTGELLKIIVRIETSAR